MTSNHNTDRPYKKGKPDKDKASMNRSRGESKPDRPGGRDSGRPSGAKRSYPRKDSGQEEPQTRRFASSGPRRGETSPTSRPGRNRREDPAERPGRERREFPRKEHAAPSESGRREKSGDPEKRAGESREQARTGSKREYPSKERAASGRSSFSGRDKSGTYQKKERSSRARSESTYNPERRPETFRSDAPVRLNKYIAHAGICSRREADTLITSGAISVNGQVVTELGTKVKPGDIVRYGDQRLVNERKVYILLNKPKDYITTSDDPQGRKTVLDLVYRACPERVYPVGRLDRNTTGLLLFTNDGEMAKKLTHPRHGVNKIYHVHLDKPLTKADLEQIAKGVELEDVTIVPDAISYIEGESKKEVGIQIHSGQNRIVRRIFEKMGYDVQKLDRVSFAGLTKKDLPRGKWRFLSEKEVNFLKMLK